MSSNYPPQALYYIADALSCIIFLVGLVAGIIAITRKRTLPGILAVVAFFLLGLDVLFQILLPSAVFPVMVRQAGDQGVYTWLFYCLTTPLFLLGAIALVALAFSNIGAKAKESAPEATQPPIQ
jgi:Ca2+/Na+ antiporter